ncbi:MAG: hypothetical protein GX638_17035 [Crenarchaeota archaeon]|nr:hypothetical protein [Thermoproteota archaeon]
MMLRLYKLAIFLFLLTFLVGCGKKQIDQPALPYYGDTSEQNTFDPESGKEQIDQPALPYYGDASEQNTFDPETSQVPTDNSEGATQSINISRMDGLKFIDKKIGVLRGVGPISHLNNEYLSYKDEREDKVDVYLYTYKYTEGKLLFSLRYNNPNKYWVSVGSKTDGFNADGIYLYFQTDEGQELNKWIGFKNIYLSPKSSCIIYYDIDGFGKEPNKMKNWDEKGFRDISPVGFSDITTTEIIDIPDILIEEAEISDNGLMYANIIDHDISEPVIHMLNNAGKNIDTNINAKITKITYLYNNVENTINSEITIEITADKYINYSLFRDLEFILETNSNEALKLNRLDVSPKSPDQLPANTPYHIVLGYELTGFYLEASNGKLLIFEDGNRNAHPLNEFEFVGTDSFSLF